MAAAPMPAPTPYRFGIDASFPTPFFPPDNRLTSEGVELGRRLFFDKGISRDGTVACATCHKAESCFADGGHEVSTGIGGAKTRRNSMPLFNLAWRRNFFWDGRTTTIRQQVMHPLQDPKEMAANADQLCDRLGRDMGYAAAFEAAFGPAKPTSTTLALALEQFLLVQISQNSKFDRARRGETTFTAEEDLGLRLFFTEFDPGRNIRGADCFHCHGNVLFTNERYANNGLGPNETDKGRFEATNVDYDKWCFKVPSLRNVELTGPYMHDGRFKTLEEVVDHYDHGVKVMDNLDPNIAKHGGPMNLPPEARKALVAFLKTLTDESFVKRAVEEKKPPRP